jgi:hypothetical protein
MSTVLQLYEKLKPKLGEEETRELLEYVDRMVESRAATKADLQQAVTELRGELQQAVTGLRGEFQREISRVEVGLRKELQGVRTDILKWSFAFWVGNVAAVSAILFAMLRAFR